jgi:hypothetical protein
MELTTLSLGTYSVVAFIVTVRLVEKSWKSKVGTDIVVSLRLQYSIVERIWMMKRIILPINPSHEPFVATISFACIAAVLAAAVAISKEEDTLSEVAMVENGESAR